MTSTVKLPVQMGCKNADKATDFHVMELRNLLSSFCKSDYCSEIDEFVLILRVDGEIWHWNFEGCQKLRRNRKERYITIDIGVPRDRWENVHPYILRKYLAENIELALDLCIERLKKDKSDINGELLLNDFQKVKTIFLKKDAGECNA